MRRNCDVCGASYHAQRRTSKYCSASCRARKAQGARKRESAPATPLPSSSDDSSPQSLGEVSKATKSELDAADRTASALGQAALALARQIDEGRDPGTGVASMVKQLQATLAAALADAKPEEDPLDELAAWRERKIAAARSR